ncbi:MAG: D-glycero-beta-D-manno-heptose 1-phosphate adenylyltransferase [Planctomycetota bacterium]|nr:D-glycero-beta-D-manno-heptose 1-phosphate adenylyltransferase [Planctomycetota bacterium]
MDELIRQINAFGQPKVVVLGDFMLDRTIRGHAERLSPDAPVPVLNYAGAESSVGGAGHVATALGALGARAVCVGLIGPDEAGEEMARLLSQTGTDVSGLVETPTRPTTVKTRYVGLAQHRHAQHMLRVDNEVAAPATGALRTALEKAFRKALRGAAMAAVQDHNKGVVTDEGMPALIAAAAKAGVPVIVDPALIKDYRRYRGAMLLCPNRYEAALASGVSITDEASLARAAQAIIDAADAKAVLITLDKEGAYVYPAGGPGRRIAHPRPRHVFDVSGAGDEVLAMVGLAMAEGADVESAAALANVAGGLEVEQVGFVPITRGQVLDELDGMTGTRRGKVLDRETLSLLLERRRQRGQRTVFTNGCFDLLHLGHVKYLQQARAAGSCLVVAINSDASVRRLKGAGRPIIAQDERAQMLACLECVDYVTIFDEDTPEALLRRLRPDVLAKGGTTPVIVGREIVEAYGGKVVSLVEVKGLSTTQIIQRIMDTHNDSPPAPAPGRRTRRGRK